MKRRYVDDSDSHVWPQHAKTDVLTNGRTTSPTSTGQRLKRRARRTISNPSRSSSGNSEDNRDLDVYSVASIPGAARRELKLAPLPGPAFPMSAYEAWGTVNGCPIRVSPATRLTSESDALDLLQAAWDKVQARRGEKLSSTSFRLEEFVIYRPERVYGGTHDKELVSLSQLRQDGYPEFRFDSILYTENERVHVQGIPFRVLSIDGYGEKGLGLITEQIYISSRLLEGRNVFYQLGSPAPEYRRFYYPFLWLVQFTKFFVRYLQTHRHVTIEHFRGKFYNWLRLQNGRNIAFEAWLDETASWDFRTRVAADVVFLYKECYTLDNQGLGLLKHPIWGEVDPRRLTAISRQPSLQERTIVTPRASKYFRYMYFGDQLQQHEIASPAVQEAVDKQKAALGLTPREQLRKGEGITSSIRGLEMEIGPKQPFQVSPGDVVHVHAGKDSTWGSGPWYAYVQDVRVSGSDTVLDIIWLYTPRNTIFGNALYEFQNELFFSDHCECGKDALHLDCVIEKVDVHYFATDPAAETGFFVRQKFRTVHEDDTYDFVSLKKSDFKCGCQQPKLSAFDHCRSLYAIGDTVLVRERHQKGEDDRLEPAHIVGFDDIKKRVELRRLLRKCDQGTDARPNELLLTNELFTKAPSHVIRKCHIRFFPEKQFGRENAITPYDRDGAGDFFYIASEAQATCEDNMLPPITQGWHPKTSPRKEKLRGMSIFCGGGTFDRGLEEGGAVEFQYAADWEECALHSSRANVQHPDKVRYFLGSVDDLLARAMDGDEAACIIRPGEVDIISAGSPCQGFTQAQRDKQSEQSKRNASKVASVVSYADFYSPKYLILENVVTMTAPVGPKRQNVLSQLVAALVSLGYQVSQFLMDAWSYGSPQQRSRVFVVASAPNLPPLKQPPQTHGHPSVLTMKERALGRASNGKKFARRKDTYTPFPCLSAASAIADLPALGDAQPQLCALFPDHRTSRTLSASVRSLLALIPKLPFGAGLVQAHATDRLRGKFLAAYLLSAPEQRSAKSLSYTRAIPTLLFPTLMTRLEPRDARKGRAVHWHDDRILTNLEARRCQGYPDWEVLVGAPGQQMRIVGNSVDRKVALVLGLALREAWMEGGKEVEEQGEDGLSVV